MHFSLVPALLLLLNISLPVSALPSIDGAKNSGIADAGSAALVVENLAEALLSACDNGADDDEKSSLSSRKLSGVILVFLHTGSSFALILQSIQSNIQESVRHDKLRCQEIVL